MSGKAGCIGCGGTQVTPGVLEGLNIVTCRTCGLRYSIRSEQQNYQDAYSGTSGVYAEHLAVLDRFHQAPDIKKLLLPFERRILDLIIERGKPMHVVDMGCGTGRFLRAVREVSQSATGYEVAEVLVRRLKFHGCHVILGGIAEFLAVEDRSPCDVLCLLEVLEHLESPGKIIEDIVNIKKPDLLFIVVPNYLIRRFFDGKFARHDVPPNHLSWWAESALERVLSRSGYGVRIESIPETRRSMFGHLVQKMRGEKSKSGVTDWLLAFVAPPRFWLLGIAEKL